MPPGSGSPRTGRFVLIRETATPHRAGAALSYAPRYALFALVGIAGEDDLDTPDLLSEPFPALAVGLGGRKPPKGCDPKPLLAAEPSAALHDQLIAEITGLKTSDELALWAHRRLPAKNTLTRDHATAVEAVDRGLSQRRRIRFRDNGICDCRSRRFSGRSDAKFHGKPGEITRSCRALGRGVIFKPSNACAPNLPATNTPRRKICRLEPQLSGFLI
jgi:hypothetical protein